MDGGLVYWSTYTSLGAWWFNTLRPRQNGSHLPDDIFKYIFLNENVWISLKISLKFVPRVPINNIPALVLIMAWRRPGDKPLSEPMMVSSPMHICVTRPQWVNTHKSTHRQAINLINASLGSEQFSFRRISDWRYAVILMSLTFRP